MTRRILFNRVIESVADAAERWHQPGRADLVAESPGSDLDSVIGMDNPAGFGTPVANGHVERVNDHR